MTSRVTQEDVDRVAQLAHLKLAPEEAGAMQRDLNAILGYIDELNELDTANVAPLEQVSELADQPIPALRPDEKKASLDRGAVMAQAPESDGFFFKVPKVIER